MISVIKVKFKIILLRQRLGKFKMHNYIHMQWFSTQYIAKFANGCIYSTVYIRSPRCSNVWN